MVLGLEFAAVLLISFAVWAARSPADGSRLRIASRVMAWITTVAAFLVPTAVLVTFLFPENTGALNLRLYHIGAGLPLTNSIPLDHRLIAFVCAMVPLGIAIWGLVSLRRLLLLYAHDEVFTAKALTALRAITVAPLWYVVASFLAQAPISLALSWHDGAGHRVVTLSIGLDDLVPLFIAGVATVIVHVMAKARGIADENKSFV